jgi:hypothetical protein
MKAVRAEDEIEDLRRVPLEADGNPLRPCLQRRDGIVIEDARAGAAGLTQQGGQIVPESLDSPESKRPPVAVRSKLRSISLPVRSMTVTPFIRVRSAATRTPRPIAAMTSEAGPRISIACPPGRGAGARSTRVTS